MRTLLFLLLTYPLTLLADIGIVVKVVDGDTIKVKHDGIVENFRLAGIDTPETYLNRKAKKDIEKCHIDKKLMFRLGLGAKYFVKRHYQPGDEITYTVVDVGVYGRPVVYVPMLNMNLVRYGYARVIDYRNLHRSVMLKLKELEKNAQDHNLGIWKYLNCWRTDYVSE